jgi:solute carrier family 13 (sodium-dependent dicarboxylate transporter), member 2/3/5
MLAATAKLRYAGLLAGPVLFLSLLFAPPPEGMPDAAWRTAAAAVWMAVWWITEAIPIAATALLPLALFPVLAIESIEGTAAPYANPIIFLFMGGFMMAGAFQRWGLHRRIALSIVHRLGTRPRAVVAGFMLASASVSMWVSNTATAVMMLPIGLSVVGLVAPPGTVDVAGTTEAKERNLGVCMMLGIAYACSIGGLGTLIGTPPNALLAGFMAESYGVRIGFGEWMLVGVPLVVVTLPLTWLLLTRFIFPLGSDEIPGGRELIRRQRAELGPLSRPELVLAVLVTLVALGWIFQPLLARRLPGISDAGIAVTGALLMFVLPARLADGEFLLDWETAARLPWDVLILFGGGLSLAGAISRSGLSEWIGLSLGGLDAWPAVGVTLAVTTVVIFLTELTSNTATAAAFLPIAGSVAIGMGLDPLLLAAPAAVAASCAFMLPVATPPNAIVYGTGFVRIPEMARAGLYLNLMFIVAITALTYSLLRMVLVA